jgi:hypothetical protein
VLVGAVADVLMMRAAMVVKLGGGSAAQGLDLVDRDAAHRIPLAGQVVLRVTLVRLIALVPAALAGAWAASRLVATTYHQLILPDDLAMPLALRALRDAADAAAVVVVIWLVGEFVGGLAARHLIARGGWTLAAFSRSLAAAVRRPGASLATFVLPTVSVAALAAPVLIASTILWSQLQGLLADDSAVLLIVPVTFLFVAVWGGGLLLVGLVATWRGLLASLETLRSR